MNRAMPIAALVAALVFAGCGDDEGSDSTQVSSPDSASSSDTTGASSDPASVADPRLKLAMR